MEDSVVRRASTLTKPAFRESCFLRNSRRCRSDSLNSSVGSVRYVSMASADEVGDRMAMVEVVIVARVVASMSRREEAEKAVMLSSMSRGAAKAWVEMPLVATTLPLRPASGAIKEAAGVAAVRRMRITDFMVRKEECYGYGLWGKVKHGACEPLTLTPARRSCVSGYLAGRQRQKWRHPTFTWWR